MSQMVLLLLLVCGGIFITAAFICWLVLATRERTSRMVIPSITPVDTTHASTEDPLLEVMPEEPVFAEHELDLEWIALAASEMRTPLHVLQGYAEYLRQHLQFASRNSLINASERILQQISRLESLIDAWSATAQEHADRENPKRYPNEIVQRIRMIATRMTALHEPHCDISASSPIWAQIDTSLFDHAIAILIRHARRTTSQFAVEIVIRTVTVRDQTTLSIAIADRRVRQSGHPPQMWEELDIELARALIEEQGGWLTVEDRAAGGAITTMWLPNEAIISLPQPANESTPIQFPRKVS